MSRRVKQRKAIRQEPPLLGAHFSIAGGLHRAISAAGRCECNVLQLFTKNASTWKERAVSEAQIEQFNQARAAAGVITIASHSSYLINLAAPDADRQARSRSALYNELMRAGRLGIDYVVLHPGFHLGTGESAALKRIVDSIDAIFERTGPQPVRLLLETTAGQGSSIGHRFEQLARLDAAVSDSNRMGICLDTCHIFAAGYDLRTPAAYRHTWAEFERIIGLDRLYLMHLNDSKRELGSRVDRHEHIGQGQIGMRAFRRLMNDRCLAHVPKIIETPKNGGQGDDADAANLHRLVASVKDKRYGR